MLQKTTHRGLCESIYPLTWRYRVNHLDPHRNELAGKWTFYHLESRFKSIRDNVGAFLFTNGNFVEAYIKPRKYQYEAADSLWLFCTDAGVTIKLKSDM